MATPSTIVTPSLNATFGVLLIGSFVATILYGLTTHQFFRYFRMYPLDPKYLRTMVGTLWMLDSTHIVLYIHACYHYLVTYYCQPAALLNGVWSLRLSLSITSAITLVTHLFFAHRIFRLNGGNWILPFFVAFIAIARLGFSIALTVVSFTSVTFARFTEYDWLATTSLGMAAATDVSLAFTLCYYLHAKKSGFSLIPLSLDKSLVYFINTGLFTSILIVVDVICVATMPDNLIYMSLYFVITKFYTNSLMAVLNARRSEVQESQIGSFDLAKHPSHHINMIQLSEFEAADGMSKAAPNITVEVTQEVEVHH